MVITDQRIRVLMVCSGNVQFNRYIIEQADSLRKLSVDVEFFLIHGKGLFGYLKNLPALKRKLREQKFHLIHAYYGFSGLLATLQRQVPVITTFLGSDVNVKRNLPYSFLASRRSAHSILCHRKLNHKLNLQSRSYSVINFGLDTDFFKPQCKQHSRNELELDQNAYYVLFSSSFDKVVKNYSLARKALDHARQRFDIIDLELKGYSKDQVKDLFNAVDMLLITSFSETGPIVAKEAMACETPLISTDVGDVKELSKGKKGCYICDYDPIEIGDRICQILESGETSNARNNILDYDHIVVSEKILDVYNRVIADT